MVSATPHSVIQTGRSSALGGPPSKVSSTKGSQLSQKQNNSKKIIEKAKAGSKVNTYNVRLSIRSFLLSQSGLGSRLALMVICFEWGNRVELLRWKLSEKRSSTTKTWCGNQPLQWIMKMQRLTGMWCRVGTGCVPTLIVGVWNRDKMQQMQALEQQYSKR